VFSSELGRRRTVPDQNVASVGCVNDLKALRLGGADDDDFVDSGMGLEGVCGADCGVSGDQQANPHVGRTGFHSSAGSASSPLRRNASAAAAASMIKTRGERRFTNTSV